VAQTLAVNDLYDKMWVYYNFFQPVMRLQKKTSVPIAGQPYRFKRAYDDARTPFERLCATDAIPQGWKEELVALRDNTNPRQLRREIYDLIDYIANLPSATPGVTEDIHHTLATYLVPEQPIENSSVSGATKKPKTPKKEGTSLVTLSFEGTIPLR
jgi:hypothetical protein